MSFFILNNIFLFSLLNLIVGFIFKVEKRALEIWETEEALEEALNKKQEQQDANKKKKFEKKMKG